MKKYSLPDRITAAFAAMLITLGTVGCQRENPPDSAPVSAATTPSLSESSVSSEQENTSSLSPQESDEPSEEPPSRETADSAEPIPETADSNEPIPESFDSAEPVTEETEPPKPVQTAEITTIPTETATEVTTAATAATTATTAEKPPAPVIIPDVKTVSSPGTATVSAGGGVVDYSNAASGYISVCYTGSSDKVKLRLINGDLTNDHTIVVGQVEYVPLSLGNGNYSVGLYERVEGTSYAEVLVTSIDVKISDEVGMFLYPNKYCVFDKNSDCVRKGAELCAGVGGTVDKVAAIFNWISENVTYDYDLQASIKANYVPYPDSTLASGKGVCFDYASLFAAMARSQGIPTRLVIGYSKDIYHAWNEVWTEETGWITPELLLDKKGYNRIDATFYASNENKEKISEYIMNGGNYNAVYYY